MNMVEWKYTGLYKMGQGTSSACLRQMGVKKEKHENESGEQPSQNRPAAGSMSCLLQRFDHLH